jgi:hypothetical protein
MNTAELIAAIDQELSILREARNLLTGNGGMVHRPGRPPATSFSFGNRPRKKRFLSTEARAKIAAAQKKRWAKQKAAKRST